VPLAWPGLVTAAVLGFARSIGEFGATLMIAGSIPGETRTIPLYIFAIVESPDGIARAQRLVLVSIVIAAAALVAGELLERRALRKGLAR
jgi:molybdate transport system permease protein